jgi:hypothetical protein
MLRPYCKIEAFGSGRSATCSVKRELGDAFRSAGILPAFFRAPTKVKRAGKMPALLKPPGISCRAKSVTADALVAKVGEFSNPLVTLAVIPQTRENERRRNSSILELLDVRLGGGSS